MGDDEPFATPVNHGSDNAITEVGRDVRDFWRHLDMKFLEKNMYNNLVDSQPSLEYLLDTGQIMIHT